MAACHSDGASPAALTVAWPPGLGGSDRMFRVPLRRDGSRRGGFRAPRVTPGPAFGRRRSERGPSEQCHRPIGVMCRSD
eukprot:761513-Hanusia_phi.AAC.3